MVIEAIGRRLRLAVIGGGPGSVIGEVHRIAARLDGYYDIVAATLSSDPERARQAGIAIGPSWQECGTKRQTKSIALSLRSKTALRDWLLWKPLSKVPRFESGKQSKCL